MISPSTPIIGTGGTVEEHEPEPLMPWDRHVELTDVDLANIQRMKRGEPVLREHWPAWARRLWR